MSDQYIQVQPNSTGLKVDTSELVVNSNTVERQRIVLADPAQAEHFVNVSSAGALQGDGSAVTQPVSGAFWQTTQPVSLASLPALPTGSNAIGSVSVSNLPGTQPVSGTVTSLTEGAVTTAAPTYATATNQQLSLNTAGGLRVDPSGVTSPVSISGTPSVTVSNASLAVTGTFYQGTQPVSGTVTANAGSGTFGTSDANAVAQGSTTSGEKGFLELAAVTTAAPTYTTGQSSPLSLNTAGGLRVDGSGVTHPVSISGTPTVTVGNASLAVTGTFYQGTQPVSGTVTANAGSGTFNTSDANAVAQGSTTSGEHGFLELGAVTTSAPSYTTGQSSPLSLNAAGGLRVDGSGVTQPVSLTSLPALATGSNVIGAVSQNGTWIAQLAGSTFTIGGVKITDGTNYGAVKAASTAAATTDPSLVVNISPNSPAHPVSQSGTWTVQPGNTANTTPWLTSLVPATSGGLSITKLVSAATTNATSVKTSAGQLYNVQAFNTNTTSPRYLKLYNLAAAPTVGTSVPVATFLIPPNYSGFVIEVSNGIAFATGIAFAITGGMADTDSTAIAAAEVVVNLQYK